MTAAQRDDGAGQGGVGCGQIEGGGELGAVCGRRGQIPGAADEDLRVADPLLNILQLSAGYLGARFAGALLGTGSWPGDVLQDAAALARARQYFSHPPDMP